MGGRVKVGALTLVSAGALLLAMVAPAVGEQRIPGPPNGAEANSASRDDAGCCPTDRRVEDEIARDCEDAAMGGPGPEDRTITLTSDLTDRGRVAPGQDVVLHLRWDPARWKGEKLDAALTCVRVRGGLAPDLSGEERPADNDGVIEYVLHVPDDIRPGCDVCAKAYLAGTAAGGGFEQASSERYCFMTGPPAPPAPPAPPVVKPPAPAPPVPVSVIDHRQPTEVTTDVGAIGASVPAEPAPMAELPRTGAGSTRGGSAAGGVGLALGGLALMGGARSRRARNRRAGAD